MDLIHTHIHTHTHSRVYANTLPTQVNSSSIRRLFHFSLFVSEGA